MALGKANNAVVTADTGREASEGLGRAGWLEPGVRSLVSFRLARLIPAPLLIGCVALGSLLSFSDSKAGRRG